MEYEESTNTYIVTSIRYKCPRCDNKIADGGHNINELFTSVVICEKCGFVGRMPR